MFSFEFNLLGKLCPLLTVESTLNYYLNYHSRVPCVLLMPMNLSDCESRNGEELECLRFLKIIFVVIKTVLKNMVNKWCYFHEIFLSFSLLSVFILEKIMFILIENQQKYDCFTLHVTDVMY